MIESQIGAALGQETTFRTSSVAMCVADPDGLIVATNAAFDLGMGPCKARPIASLFIHAEARASAEAALRSVFKEAAPVVFSGLCSTAGPSRILSWSCRAVDGVILAESSDETERVASARELDALLRALPDIYFRLDADGRIVAFHAARETEFHVPPERLIGQRPHDLVPPDVAPIIAAAVDRVASERVPVQIEYSLPTPSGDDQFEASLVPCGDSEVTAIIRNTTARRRAEAALRASEERLRASQKLDAIGKLAGGVAHDFNNLLGVVLGRLTFLKRAEGLAATDRAHVDEAFDAAMHAASLTRQLLAFGRRQVMQPKVFDLNSVLSSMHEMLHRVAGEHIEVVVALAPSTCSIDSDPVQIEQVVLNLVLNARHAMPNGGTLMVSTGETWLDEKQAAEREAKPGACITLTVADTGCGMRSEVLAHLFEPFFTTKPYGEGTGLGLATVYGIVKQSGGHIVVRSEVAVGSTFEVCFPRASEDQVEPAAAEPPASSFRSARGHGEIILVVEDGSGLRELVVEILKRAGYTALSAAGGEEALRIVLEERERIALVLTDVVMPKMNGRTLAARIRQLRPDMQILLMSGYETSMEARHREVQGNELLFPLIEKPFTEDALLARVRDILDRASILPLATLNRSNTPTEVNHG